MTTDRADIPPDVSEIIALAWDDETSFEAIKAQTGLDEEDVIALMRRHMKPSSFRMWRKRVSGRTTKHRDRASALERRHRLPPPLHGDDESEQE
ncbi:MAG: TIGR03643 family protein [Pseudomonadota bacterium]